MSKSFREWSHDQALLLPPSRWLCAGGASFALCGGAGHGGAGPLGHIGELPRI